MSILTEPTKKFVDDMVDSTDKTYKHNSDHTVRFYKDGEVLDIRPLKLEMDRAYPYPPPYMEIEKDQHERIVYAIAEADRFDKIMLPFRQKCRQVWDMFTDIVLHRSPYKNVQDACLRGSLNWHKRQAHIGPFKLRLEVFWHGAKEVFYPPLPAYYTKFYKTA